MISELLVQGRISAAASRSTSGRRQRSRCRARRHSRQRDRAFITAQRREPDNGDRARDPLGQPARRAVAITPRRSTRTARSSRASCIHERRTRSRPPGLELDTIKIQHVSDDRAYLNSIGRHPDRRLLQGSRIAEADEPAPWPPRTGLEITDTGRAPRWTEESRDWRAEEG